MKQKRSESTQDKILASAMQIYRDIGSVQIPVSLLSERSGISVGSIYHHFESMEGVAAALYMRCLGSLLDAVSESLLGAQNISHAVKKIVRTYLSWTGANPYEAKFVHASFAAPFISHYKQKIDACRSQRIEKIANRVMLLLPEKMRRVNPALIEIMIIGPAAETSRRWLTGEPGVDLKQAAKLLPQYILDGLMANS